MEQEILSLLSNLFKLEKIDKSLTQKDLSNWDSLTHMDLIASLENQFNLVLTMDEIVQMTSVEAILNIVLSKTNEEKVNA